MPILLEQLIASFCESLSAGDRRQRATRRPRREGFDAGIRLGQFIAADMVAVRCSRPAASAYRRRKPHLSRPPRRAGAAGGFAPSRLSQAAPIPAARPGCGQFEDNAHHARGRVGGAAGLPHDFPTSRRALEGLGPGARADRKRSDRSRNMLEPYAPMTPCFSIIRANDR